MTATTDETKLVDYLKRATAELRDTRQRLRALEDSLREPVAIVGMGCRLRRAASTRPSGCGRRSPRAGT